MAESLRGLNMPSGLDRPLLMVSLTLALLGLVMVTSASLQIAESSIGNAFHYSVRHGTYLLMGTAIAAVIVYFLPLLWLRDLRVLMLPVVLITLALVFVPGLGHTVNGSTRWIKLPGFTVQSSEVVKLCFILYLAGYIDRYQEELLTSWKRFFMPLFVLAIIAVLLLMQPDFGAVVVLAIMTMGMLFLAGVPLIRYGLVVLAGLLLMALVAVAEPYRVARLMSFMDPWADQFGAGYQLTQSLIAFGRGDLFGVGLGNSVQKLFYLPEAHTDFVFAVIAEELGMLGSLLLISAFVFLLWRVFRMGLRLQQQGMLYHAFVVYGCGLVLSSQVVINLSVNMGLLPTKGLTLPLISFGGSSLLIVAVMVGLILRAGIEGNNDMQASSSKVSKGGRGAA